MGIDASFPRKNGDRARLISPSLPIFPIQTSGYCLTWYYHMLGIEMGTLSVYLKTEGFTGLLWRLNENVGDIWNAAQVTIKKIPQYDKFSVVFEGFNLK